MKAAIEAKISEVLMEAGVREPRVLLEYPADPAHGDMASGAALAYAKEAGKNPRDLADAIAEKFDGFSGVERVEIAGPGFINFFLKAEVFADTVSDILANPDSWGKSDALAGKTLLIEHSSPNLFKPFHIGHLVNNTIGESLVRISQFSGAKVVALSYPSDISLGIAKAVWGLRAVADINERTMGEAYVQGVAAYENDEDAKEEIDRINKALYEKEAGEAYERYWKGREFSLEYFQKIVARLGSHFDDLIFESEAEVVGKRVVREHIPNVFEESNGATIFRGSKYGLFDNVFINAAGYATYLGKDIGLLDIKFRRYAFDTSLTVTDVEQKQHFELVKKAAELINPVWATQSEFIHHGRLQFAGGKVSSRYGNVPLLEDLLAQVASVIEPRVRERIPAEHVAARAEDVAIAALKYSILKVSTGKNMTFDFEHSLSTEGDSGPYLQYAHARAHSIVTAAVKEGVRAQVEAPQNGEERELIRILMQFPDAIARARDDREPHHVANYASHLAARYNSWYVKARVIGEPEAPRRLALTQAIALTLNHALLILGIPAPDQM